MASIAKTACSRCRRQKLRCSRELPRCDRCTRLSALCAYPDPPDQSALAEQRVRTQSKKKVAEKATRASSALDVVSAPRPRPPLGRDASASQRPRSQDTEPPNVLDVQLSIPIQVVLQDVFFTCMFNASLVLHRPSFSRAFEDGRLPRHVLLAVYASATIFLPHEGTHKRQNASLLAPLGNLRPLGRKWAIQAGREVLQGMDRPSFESVQTCEMLTLYWFSQGDSQRNTMFSGIAYKAACVLGLDNPGRNDQSSEEEATRRCFWAVWFTQCINSDHRLRGTHDERVMNLPLPMDEETVFLGPRRPPRVLSMSGRHSPRPSEQELGDPSIMAELMTAVLHWSKIRELIQATKRMPVKEWLAEMWDLDGKLSSWAARLPNTFTYSKRNLYEQLVINEKHVFTFVHAIHYQSRLVLHSALVPQFSGLHVHETLPPEAVSLSARIALGSAQMISEMASDLLALNWDASQVAPFVGYGTYVSASIYITLLHSKDHSLAALARNRLVPNLKLLKSMTLYWANLERLWIRINVLYAAEMAKPAEWTDEAVSRNVDTQAHLSELDRLAGEARQTGELSEPLADSVLDYTLKQLEPTADVNSSMTQQLDDVLSQDDLSRFMVQEGLRFPAQDPVLPLGTADGSWTYENTDQRDADALRMLSMPATSDLLGSAGIPSLQGNLYEWWNLNLDSLTAQPCDDRFVL